MVFPSRRWAWGISVSWKMSGRLESKPEVNRKGRALSLLSVSKSLFS